MQTQCKHCHCTLQVPDVYVGRIVKCTSCWKSTPVDPIARTPVFRRFVCIAAICGGLAVLGTIISVVIMPVMRTPASQAQADRHSMGSASGPQPPRKVNVPAPSPKTNWSITEVVRTRSNYLAGIPVLPGSANNKSSPTAAYVEVRGVFTFRDPAKNAVPLTDISLSISSPAGAVAHRPPIGVGLARNGQTTSYVFSESLLKGYMGIEDPTTGSHIALTRDREGDPLRVVVRTSPSRVSLAFEAPSDINAAYELRFGDARVPVR